MHQVLRKSTTVDGQVRYLICKRIKEISFPEVLIPLPPNGIP
jgi:hypothetical protein